MSCPLPLCCVMGTCAYDVLYWQRVCQERNKRNLPCGVYDDKRWTSPKDSEIKTREGGGLKMKDIPNAHKKLEKKSSVWSPFTARKDPGNRYFLLDPYQSNCRIHSYYINQVS